MDNKTAKNVGSKQGIISVTIGLLIASLILVYFYGINGMLWVIKDSYYKYNLFFSIVIMYFCGHFYGQRAGYEILIKKKDYTWTGFKYGLFILWTTILLGSVIGFFQNINTDNNPIRNYIFTPILIVTLFGLIPVVVVGFWFGRQIKNKEQKTIEQTKK